MNMRIISAVASVSIAGVASAGTMSLSPVYLGSSNNVAITIPSDGGTPAGLTVLDFSQPANQTNNWIHAFKVDLDFLPANAGEDFRAITFSLGIPAGMQIVNRSGNAPTAIQTAWNKNPTIINAPNAGNISPFSNNTDGSTANDLLALNIQQTNALAAYDFQNGEPAALAGDPTNMGYFFLRTTDPTLGNTPDGKKILTSTQGNGSPFSFWTGNEEAGGAFQTVATGVEARSLELNFGGGEIPEPATLGLAAFGALGLLRRRRA